MKKFLIVTLLVLFTLFLFLSFRQGPPIRMAKKVNLDQFMGDWYVIANIPTLIEKGAHNAVESYRRQSKNVIATRFTFNQDSFTGTKKEYNPTGFVQSHPSNAQWKMQFFWPFKSEFIIIYIDADYQYTIIGRTLRDYLWIMAREPHIDQNTLGNLIQIAVDEGYDRNAIQLVPHQ